MADRILFELVVDSKGVPKSVKQVDDLSKATDRAEKSTKKLGKQQDKYNRLQKGTAELGMNTTKSFSKMQQNMDGGGGSGGLVRAYALLAANVFALTAAFGVLSRSAQIDTLIQSMEILSTTGGTYIKTIARDMQAASGYAIDLAQAFRQVSLASSAGLSTKEIEGLTMVAKGAAISLGRDLPDAMDRIFRGAIKMEPEILDEIGLFVRVDEAAQMYARSLGKSVSALTLAEKRQGFLNQILDQGTRKFQEYAEEIKPDVYTQLSSALLDVSQIATSFINMGLGPIISFLTENPKVLALAFGSLVTFLLSKAIPAIGAFSFDAAAGAANALAEEEAYIAKIKESLNVEVSKEERVQQEVLETQRIKGKALAQTSKDMKKFPSRAEGAKANLKALGKETSAEKRIVLLNKRKGILEKASKKAKGENLELIKKEIKARDKELRNLERQLQAEKKILKLQKEQNLEAKKGTLAAKRMKKLQDTAARTTVVAGATGVAETEGMKAGWANLKKSIKEGVTDPVTGAKTEIKGFNKGLTYLSGGAQIAAVGFQNLMATIGPFLMLLPIIIPLLTKLAESLGFNSKEATAFDESLSKVSESLENMGKRSAKQVSGLKDLGLEWVENRKAGLAFYKGLEQVSAGLIETNKALIEFEKEAEDAVMIWENFKALFGWSREQLFVEEAVDSLALSISRLSEISKDQALKVYGDQFADAIEMTQTQEVVTKALAREEEKRYGKRLWFMERMVRRQHEEFATGLSREDFDKKTQGDKVKRYWTLIRLNEKIDVKQQLNNLTRKELLRLLMDENEFAAHQAKLYENLISAYEGAAESIGKFQQAFIPKTKVDEVVSSFEQMISTIEKMKEEGDKAALSEFWTSFADPSNPFTAIISSSEEVKKAEPPKSFWDNWFGPMKETKEVSKETFEAILEELKGYQRAIIVAKTQIKAFSAEQKNFNKIAAAGAKANRIEQQAITGIAKQNAIVSRTEFEMHARTVGLTKEEATQLTENLKLAKNRKDVMKIMSDFGVSNEKALQLEGSALANHIAQLEKQIAIKTEDQRITKQTAEINLKATEEAFKKTKALQKTLELQTKLSNMMLGGSGDMTIGQQAKFDIKVAKEKLEYEMSAIKLKKEILKAEFEILKIRIEILGRDAGMKKDEITALQKTMGRGFESQQGVLDEQLKQTAASFSIVLAEAITKSFKSGGMVDSMQAMAAAFAEGQGQQLNDQGQYTKVVDGTEVVVQAMTKQMLITQQLKNSFTELAETMGQFGPDGILVAGIAQGSLTMMEGMANLKIGMNEINKEFMEDGNLKDGVSATEVSMAKMSQTAQMVGSALGAVGQMMAANSRAQIAEIDQQIAAEKQRDGKSKESLAKIAGMEKKKDAMARKAFETQKKVQMATTIANTAAAVMGALAPPPMGFGMNPVGIAMASIAGAMGALQLAVISKTKYAGGIQSIEKPNLALTIGKRSEKVDVSRGASRGELGYLRGERGVGMANAFTPTGGAGGLRKGYATGTGEEDILVGERGPEIVTARGPYEVIPNDALGGGASNVNFTINAVDAAGVEDVLMRQRGNIIGMLRQAANDSGERFLESVDTDVVGYK